MDILIQIVHYFLIGIIPYFLIRISKASKIDSILSPVVLCYAVGLFFSNFFPSILNINVAKTLTEITIVFAIPLILMNSDFKGFLNGTRSILISFGIAIFSALLMCVLGAFVFKNQVDESAEIAGMLTGVYTGGTPNMASIRMAIGANENTYITLNIADIILSGIYLIFLTSIGVKIFRYILPHSETEEKNNEHQKENIWKQFDFIAKLKNIIKPLLLSILVVGITMGLNQLLFEKDNVSFIIICITLLGIIISFFPSSKKLYGAYEVGDYLLLIFSLALGLQSNFSEILNASFSIILFTAFVLYGSIFLHIIFCRFLKIDADIVMITSTACIFGPVFVGQIVSVLKNKSVLVPGMAMGVIGIAIGNFLGIAIYHLTQLMF